MFSRQLLLAGVTALALTSTALLASLALADADTVRMRHGWRGALMRAEHAARMDCDASRFDAPPDEPALPYAQADYDYAVAYIRATRPKADAEGMAAAICTAQAEYPALPLKLALCIIKRESSFNPTDRNRSSGCYGLFQLHPRYHKRPLAAAGWDWYSPLDNARYGFKHVQDAVDSGASLKSACGWWTVRNAAWREWEGLE